GIAVGIAVGVVGVVLTTVNAWLAIANERKRTQPIVMAHQMGPRRLGGRAGHFAVDTFLTNEGSGAAFNVRFGVEFHGVRLPYKYAPEDHHAGSVYRVVGAGERLPKNPAQSWPLQVDASMLVGKRGDPDPTRV